MQDSEGQAIPCIEDGLIQLLGVSVVNRSIVQWIVGVASFQKLSFINCLYTGGESPFSSCENGDGHDVDAGGGDAGRDHDDNNGGDDAAGGDDDADGGNVPH